MPSKNLVAVGVAAGLGGLLLLLRWRRQARAAALDEDGVDDPPGPAIRLRGGATEPPSTIAPIAEEEEELAEGAARTPQTAAECWEEATRAKERGNKRFTGRQYDQALREYSRAISIAPDATDERVSVYYCNRAACLSMLDDFVGCVRDCDMALQINPKYVKALNRRGSAHEKLDDLDAALLDYTASCLLSCFEQQATIEAADRVLKVIGQRKAEERSRCATKRLPSPNFIRTFMDSFVSHRRMLKPLGGQPQKAAQAAARREACPRASEPAKHAALLEEEAIALMGEQRYDEALVAWEAAVGAWGEAAGAGAKPGARDARRAHNMVGTFYHVRGSLEEALAEYGKALALDPSDANALIKRASLHFEREQMESCLADFGAAEKAAKGNDLADVCCHRGQVYMLRGQLEEAVAELKRGLALDSSVMLTHIQLAMSHFRLGRREESLRAFSEAERLFPKCAEVFNFHGELLVECGQLAEALAKFDQAIRVGGDRLAAAYVNKANAVAIGRGGPDEEVVSLIEKAAQVDPLSEAALVHLAQLKWQRSELAEAVELYDRAIELLRTKEELAEAFGMREAADAHLKLLKTQREIYEPAMAINRARNLQRVA